MDLDEARRLLGIEESAPSRDRVRRAYMRKLRDHPPERDPDGFQRLRAAYERVLAIAELEESRSASSPNVIRLPVTAPPPETPVVAPVTDPNEAFPTPTELLDQILDALEAGQKDVASELAALCRQRLADDRAWANWMPSARWVLVRELVDVVAVVPPSLVRGFVDALRKQDPRVAQTAFWDRKTWESGNAADLETQLVRRAPALARWALGIEPPSLEYSPLGLLGFAIVAIVIVLFLSRSCT
jgi:hypothetical protein